MTADERLRQLGYELPPAPKPAGTYRPVVVVGPLAYVSGHGPLRPDRTLVTGKVGRDLTEAQGREAARTVGLAILATLQQHFGTLNRIVRTVKVLGMVNATPEFERHPQVINGFSDLMQEVFGEPGVGARSAVGMGSLPSNIAVEVEAIFEITPE
jgi:enamine deaminase RidA (YjgF/YER057c/UK114 family)